MFQVNIPTKQLTLKRGSALASPIPDCDAFHRGNACLRGRRASFTWPQSGDSAYLQPGCRTSPGAGLCRRAVPMPRSGRNYLGNTKCGHQAPRARAVPAGRRGHRVPSHRPSAGTASLPARGSARGPSGGSAQTKALRRCGRAGRTGEGGTGEGNKGAEKDEKSQES